MPLGAVLRHWVAVPWMGYNITGLNGRLITALRSHLENRDHDMFQVLSCSSGDTIVQSARELGLWQSRSQPRFVIRKICESSQPAPWRAVVRIPRNCTAVARDVKTVGHQGQRSALYVMKAMPMRWASVSKTKFV